MSAYNYPSIFSRQISKDIVCVYVEWITTVHLLMNEFPSVVEITPIKTLGRDFKKHKNRPADKRSVERNLIKSGLQKVSVTYIDDSKRSWKSWGGEAEQKLGTTEIVGSSLKQHTDTTDNKIHPNYASILETGVKTNDKRLFLEQETMTWSHHIHSWTRTLLMNSGTCRVRFSEEGHRRRSKIQF